MKKNIILISMMVLFSSVLWGQKGDKVCLSGSVKGFSESPRLICDFTKEGVEPDVLEITPDGTFYKEYVLKETEEAFLKIETGSQMEFFIVYFVPGKSLHIDFTVKKGKVVPAYSGDTGKETTFFNLHRDIITLSPTFSAQAWQSVPNFNACVRYVDKKLAPIEKALNKVKDKAFVKKQKEGMKSGLSCHYFSYAKAKQKEGMDMEKDPDFMKFVERINFNDTLQEATLLHYIDWYVEAHPRLYKEDMPINAVKLRYLKTLVSNQVMRNKVAKTILTAHLFMQMLGADISATVPFVYREYLTVSTDPQTCEQARKQLEIIDNTAAGTHAADIKARDINGKQISLKDIVGKGKYTYIDFWATWCGPCCKEIPFIEKLVEQHKNNPLIRFVSISIDTNTNAWKKKLANDKPLWEQYIIPEADQKALAEIYGVTNIPRFMIFDKEGKMIDASAPRPSEEETIKLLNGLK